LGFIVGLTLREGEVEICPGDGYSFIAFVQGVIPAPTFVRTGYAPAFAGINYGGNPLDRTWIPASAEMTCSSFQIMLDGKRLS